MGRLLLNNQNNFKMGNYKNNGGARKGAGRKPKADEERIRDLTSPYVPNAIETVVSIMQDKDAKTSDRVSASKLLLSYAWGTPKQTIDQNNTHTMNDFNIKDILKFDSTK